MASRVVVLVLFLVSSVYVSEVRSSWGLPVDIPALSESVSRAFGDGVGPLLAVNESAAVNVARDRSGALVLVQKIIGNIGVPVDTLLTVLGNAYSRQNAKYLVITDTVNLVLFRALGAMGHFNRYNAWTSIPNARTYLAELSTKISPTVYKAVNQSLTDLNDSIIQDFQHHDNLVWALYLICNAIYQVNNDLPMTATTIAKYMTPEVVAAQAPRIANVVSAINNLAKALQMAVTEINSSLISPVIRSKLPNTFPVLGNFNASADRILTSTTHAVKSTVITLKSTFQSVTMNPFNWNNGNIDQLTTFLTKFSSLLQTTFTQSLETDILNLKSNITELLSNQIFTLALLFTDVHAHIAASTSQSNTPSIHAQACASRYNATLMARIASTQRLGDVCIEQEAAAAGSLGVVQSQAREAIAKMVKHDGITMMNQLWLCQDQNGPCVKQIFASFANQYKYAANSVTLISDNIRNSLQTIVGRATACTNALSAEIESQTKTIQHNFNGCLVYGPILDFERNPNYT